MITKSNQIELRHLRYFLAVAEELHFRNAAEKLYISQPGLSRQIRDLEDTLGYDLFERDNRNVSLTKAGTYLKKEVCELMSSLDLAVLHGKMLHDGLEGEIRVGYVGSAMQKLIPDLMNQVKKELPNSHFNLKEMENPDQIQALLSKEIDLGFVRLDEIHTNLEHRVLLTETFSLVLPVDHPMVGKAFSDLSSFREDHFILFDASYSPAYYGTVMQLFYQSGFMPKISHNTVHASSIFRLVEKGLGISIVPSSLQLGYDLDIVFIELDQFLQRTELTAVWNPINRNPMMHRVLPFLPGIRPSMSD